MRAIFAISLVLALSACSAPKAEENMIVPPDLSGGAPGTADAARQAIVRAFKVRPEEDPAAEKAIHGWPIVEEQGPLPAALAKRVDDLLESPATYGGDGARCFIPGMAFRVEKEGKKTDIVICLECKWAYFYEGDDNRHASKALSDAGLRDLAALYAEIFPGPK